jgi:hypothetical protein
MAKAVTERQVVAQPAGTASSHTWKSIQPPVDLGITTESTTSFPVETHRTLTIVDVVVGINQHT